LAQDLSILATDYHLDIVAELAYNPPSREADQTAGTTEASLPFMQLPGSVNSRGGTMAPKKQTKKLSKSKALPKVKPLATHIQNFQ